MNCAYIKTNYLKPAEFCADLTDIERDWISLEPSEFIQAYKDYIQRFFHEKGYLLRQAAYNDIIPAVNFSSKQYDPILAHEISAYDIYRFITFGHGLILEDNEAQIRGCIFEVGYDTKDRTSFSIRLGIDKDLSGHDFGRWITIYSCLLAMERGSLVKRGFIEHDNLSQIYIQLNKVGWIFDSYFFDVKGMVPTFTAVLPLTKEGLLRNRIDNNKIIDFITMHQEDTDYMLCDTDDKAKIQQIYEQTDFKICGCIKPGVLSNTFKYIAIPEKRMKLT